jgi:hypothetical protein
MNINLILLIISIALIIMLSVLLSIKEKNLKKFIDELKKERDASTKSATAHTIAMQKAEQRVIDIKEKYSRIISEEEELIRIKTEANVINDEILSIQNTYKEKRQLLDNLEECLAIYDERLAFAELGVYEPHFDFKDSEEFKRNIIEIREMQKSMISKKTAAICTTDWVVGGSKAQGQTMINRQIRLTLRAFNNECDAAIANVRWNNAVAMEKRIISAATAVNKENSTLSLVINDKYIALKIQELRMTHEYRERLKIEKEERSEMARAEREEKKLLNEAEAAEREEKKFESLLEKARKEVNTELASSELHKRIADLEEALREAHERSERARAMAEMTRSGYVYIISNIGSFGEDVFKIGLTRRLEPDDRVKELGDASVPFSFDTHAMIYSDDAPSLESALHREFADRRINMSNFRKEFFKVTLGEVESAVSKLAPDAQFYKDREAQEWHETIARRNQILTDMQSPSAKLPMEI